MSLCEETTPLPKELTADEEAAWKMYCDDTKGGLDVRDFWEELCPRVKAYYLNKVRHQVHDVVMLGALAEEKACEKCGAWRRFYQCLQCGISLCRECGQGHETKNKS